MFKRLFKKKSVTSVTAPKPSRVVLSTLEDLCSARTPLFFSHPSFSEQYSAVITEVDEAQGNLCLVSLLPDMDTGDWDKTAITKIFSIPEQGKSIRFESQLQDEQKRFVEAIKEESEFFYFPLPTKVERLDRREVYRVTVGAERNIPAHLETADNQEYAAVLQDLSFGGCGLVIEGNCADKFTFEDKVQCQFVDSNKEAPLSVNAEVRWAKYNDETENTHIGCLFSVLASKEQQLLQQYVAKLGAQYSHKRY